MKARPLSVYVIMQLNPWPAATTSLFVEELQNFCFRSMRHELDPIQLQTTQNLTGFILMHQSHNNKLVSVIKASISKKTRSQVDCTLLQKFWLCCRPQSPFSLMWLEHTIHTLKSASSLLPNNVTWYHFSLLWTWKNTIGSWASGLLVG